LPSSLTDQEDFLQFSSEARLWCLSSSIRWSTYRWRPDCCCKRVTAARRHHRKRGSV